MTYSVILEKIPANAKSELTRRRRGTEETAFHFWVRPLFRLTTRSDRSLDLATPIARVVCRTLGWIFIVLRRDQTDSAIYARRPFSVMIEVLQRATRATEPAPCPEITFMVNSNASEQATANP